MLGGEGLGVWPPMTVTVGFGELGGFVGWAFVGEGEGLLIAQADVQTVAPLHFRSDSEGQQPPSKDTDPASHPVLVLAGAGGGDVFDAGLGGGVVTVTVAPPPVGVLGGSTTVTVGVPTVAVAITVGETVVVF